MDRVLLLHATSTFTGGSGTGSTASDMGSRLGSGLGLSSITAAGSDLGSGSAAVKLLDHETMLGTFLTLLLLQRLLLNTVTQVPYFQLKNGV